MEQLATWLGFSELRCDVLSLLACIPYYAFGLISTASLLIHSYIAYVRACNAFYRMLLV